MNKKSVTLYNIIFPIWLLWLLPQTWLVVLPANFFVDLLIVVLVMRRLKTDDVRRRAKAVIFRVWLCGFLADFIGTAFMFLPNVLEIGNLWPDGRIWSDFSYSLSFNPFTNAIALVYTFLCVSLTGLIIYFINYTFCLKKAGLETRQRRILALSLAVFTAPYLFFLPTAWFF